MNATVYMLGYSYTLCDGRSSGDLPACDPVGYFDTPEKVIQYASKEFSSDGHVQEIPIDHDKCKVYRIQDGFLSRPVYIYVWTIPKAAQS